MGRDREGHGVEVVRARWRELEVPDLEMTCHFCEMMLKVLT